MCIQQLSANGSKFSTENWNELCKQINEMNTRMLPTEVLSNKKLDTSIFKSKCSTLLGIVQLIEEITNSQYENMHTAHIQQLVDSLETTATKSQQIYSQKKEYKELLSKIETNAYAAYFRILAKMYAEQNDQFKDRIEIAEKLFIP